MHSEVSRYSNNCIIVAISNVVILLIATNSVFYVDSTQYTLITLLTLVDSAFCLIAVLTKINRSMMFAAFIISTLTAAAGVALFIKGCVYKYKYHYDYYMGLEVSYYFSITVPSILSSIFCRMQLLERPSDALI